MTQETIAQDIEKLADVVANIFSLSGMICSLQNNRTGTRRSMAASKFLIGLREMARAVQEFE